MAIERLTEQCGSRFQNCPAPSGLDKLGFRVAALLKGGLGADSTLELPPLSLKPIPLRLSLLLLLGQVRVPPLKFRQTRRGGVRIERAQLLDQPRLIDPVAEIGQTTPLL
jgi:hypothetical protein